MIISPNGAAKSEMDSRILGLVLWLDRDSNHVCFVSRISASFAAKRESRQIWFSSALAKPSLFLPFVSFTLMHVYMNTEIK